MYQLTVNVTQEHIDKGECLNPHKCAIANALQVVFPYATVGGNVINLDSYEMGYKYWELYVEVVSTNEIPYLLESKYCIPTPEEARVFIQKFDNGVPVKPISFTLDIPDAYIETINIDEVKKTLENHPTLTLYEKVLC